MMPRKKLEYYAKQNGIEDFVKIKLTEDECAKICGGSVSMLIDRVMDDEGFNVANTKAGMPDDYNIARMPDYAAIAVFKALAAIRKA